MFSNIQTSQEDNRYVFTCTTGPQDVIENKMIIWNKPPGIIGLNILCIGGGGSGGCGSTVTIGTKAGAGGGGSGTITSVSILSRFIPETLYVRVGAGGASTTSGNGLVGGDTKVCIAQADLYDYYNVAIAFGGSAGYGAAGGGEVRGAAGYVVTAPTIQDMPIASCGIYSMVDGRAGERGGQLTVGNTAFTMAGSILSGGAGGGSASTGGTLYAPGSTSVNQDTNDTIRLPVISSSQSLVDGNGTTLFKPIFCSFGGAGGWASQTGTAFNGGKGGIGCGGGGGASAQTPYSSGDGGAGGDGLVIISCW